MKIYPLLLSIFVLLTVACDKEEIHPFDFEGEFKFYKSNQCGDNERFVLRHDGLWKPDGEERMGFCGTGMTDEDIERMFERTHKKVANNKYVETALALAKKFPVEYLNQNPGPGCSDAAFGCSTIVSLRKEGLYVDGTYCKEGAASLSSTEIVEYFEKVEWLIEKLE